MNNEVNFMCDDSNLPYFFCTEIPISHEILKLKVFDVTNPMPSKDRKESYFKYKVQLLNQSEFFQREDISSGECFYMDIPKKSFEKAWGRAKIKPLDPKYKWNLIIFIKRKGERTLKIMKNVEYEYY